MWRVVTKGVSKCTERRARISTAHTPERKFGLVTIADNQCGNGQFVLAKPRHQPGARWRILGAGSDWGYPARCPEDLRKIGRPVLEDFFGRGICTETQRVTQIFGGRAR